MLCLSPRIPRKLYKIGVNFSSEIRGIVEWKIVEDNS